MRLPSAVSALLGFRAAAAAAAAVGRPNGTDYVFGKYIVEFADDSDSAGFYKALEADGIQVDGRNDINSRLFKGASFYVTNAKIDDHDGSSFLSQLQAAPDVKGAWPVRSVGLAVPTLSEAPPKTAKRGVHRTRAEESDGFSPHVMTQVDKLGAEGITGKGIRVAIVDSGVDYTHPALGGCFGPGCLVEAGWDFTGDDFLPGTNEAQPDDDPMDDCQGHGTHVAGTVAAQLRGNEYGFTGAAPGAKLAAYRAWGCRATSTNEILLAAFIRAFEEGADIISCSDGDASGWTSDVWSMVAARIVDAGVPVVISAGNDGGRGLFYASTPAAGPGVAGVGAVTNDDFPTLLKAGSFSVDSNSTRAKSDEFGFLPGEPVITKDVTLQLWSAAESDDACSELPAGTDLSDKIVLLKNLDAKATGCYPPDQGANVVAKGGKYLLYYPNDNLTMRDEIYNYAEGLQGVATVPPYQAKEWLSLLSKGHQVTISLPNANSSTTRLEHLENNISGGFMGDLSSWGPTWELGLSTRVSTPGANILSTFPTALGSYRVMTGTSMSAPLLAGIYALMAEARNTTDPKRLRSMASATARPLAWFDGKTGHGDTVAPPTQQGGGIAQVYDAVHATAELDVDSIAFNDTDHFAGEQTFTVTNTGDEDLVFELGHRKAPTMYSMQPGSSPLFVGPYPNAMVDESAELRFGSRKVAVPAGGSAHVTVTCTPPASVNATLLPVYSGYVTLTSRTQALSLPYLGVVGSMASTPVLYASQVYLANFNNAVPANKTYTIPRPDPANPPPTDRGDEAATPNVSIGLSVGTPALHVDVVSQTEGSKLVGPLAGWPLPYAPRSSQRAYFNGLLADGTVLPAGTYALRVSALRVFGDASSEADWDVVTTVPFSFRYAAK